MSDDETLARLLQEEYNAELLTETKVNDEIAGFFQHLPKSPKTNLNHPLLMEALI